ncbi:MAG: hypothetical protein PUF43_04170 [Bacteroidales bacterium]|nr:hypothetical protein [Bacteroidales bacterium]
MPVYTLLRAVILDFRARLGNRCKLFPVYALFRASILDFRLKLENRCRVLPVYALFRASILDFRLKLENRCWVFPVYALLRASILDFRARLANRCSTIVVAIENGPPAAAVAARENGSACGMSWRMQAGTECHGGGIILSKKPPEWHLSLLLPVADFWCSLPPLPRGFTTGSHEGDAVKAFKVSTFLLFLRYNRRFAE